MNKITYSILLFLLISQYVSGQNFFEKVSAYEWKGKGELLGSSASFKMNWKPILDGKFYQLSFENQRDESKEYIFKAVGIYQLKNDKTFEGTWFDSRGLSFQLTGSFSKKELIVYWGSPETEEGKTIYLINEDSSISANDYVLKDRKLVQFGNASYERK